MLTQTHAHTYHNVLRKNQWHISFSMCVGGYEERIWFTSTRKAHQNVTPWNFFPFMTSSWNQSRVLDNYVTSLICYLRNAGLYIWSMQDGEMSYYPTFEVSILFVVGEKKGKEVGTRRLEKTLTRQVGWWCRRMSEKPRVHGYLSI